MPAQQCQPIKRPKVLSRAKLIQKLDSILSILAGIAAKGACEICGKAGNQTHHFFPKKMHGSVRFNRNNLLFLCFYCHIIVIHRGGCSEKARDVLIKRIGDIAFNELKKEAYAVRKYTAKDIEDLIRLYSVPTVRQ